MAIDGEPKDGDFVRYIENLTRAGGAARGRVEAERVDAGQSVLLGGRLLVAMLRKRRVPARQRRGN